jgi:hypothetical protein
MRDGPATIPTPERRLGSPQRSSKATSLRCRALVAALDVASPNPKNWTVCHIWGYDDPSFAQQSSVVQDPRYFSCVANMVWLMCHSLFKKGRYYLDDAEHTSARKLEGIVNHIYHVRKSSDTFQEVESPERETSEEKLYRQILFFKHFIDLSKPLVLCEGKTDSIYLKAATRFTYR